jgi:hypothetical protein
MKLFFEEGKRPRHTKTKQNKKQKEYKGPYLSELGESCSWLLQS